MHGKYPYTAKYQLLLNKHENVSLKHFNYPKVFVVYSNDLNDIYETIDEYILSEKRRIFKQKSHDTIADVRSNKRNKSIVTKL